MRHPVSLVAVAAEQTPEGGLGRAHVESCLDKFCYCRLNRRDARLYLFRRIPNRCASRPRHRPLTAS